MQMVVCVFNSRVDLAMIGSHFQHTQLTQGRYMNSALNLIEIHPDALARLKEFKLPEVQGFGQIISPVMVQSHFQNGKWGPLQLLPYGPLMLDPCCKVLHYGQEIFEGMKAYKVEGQSPLLFRPERNAYRMNISAERMGMPTIDPELFLTAVKTMVSYNAHLVPEKSGQSLYLRPFMIASEPQLGIAPSKEFLFLVVASPTASYFAGEVNVLIERKHARTVSGGTGTAKTGGNYAASIQSTIMAQKKNFQQVLWLDGHDRKYVEELSGMNIFAVINGELVTPQMTDTILDGITRDSIIQMAPQLGFKVHETKINIDELITAIKNKTCTEIFACGTASIVAPVKALGEADGTLYPLADSYGPVTRKIRETLLDIQEGRKVGPAGWVVTIAPQL